MLVPSIFSDNFFDDFFEFPFIDDRAEKNAERKLYGHHAANLMKTDIRETENQFELDIDLPGFKKEDVNLELKNGYLTISADKALDKDEKDDKPTWVSILGLEGAKKKAEELRAEAQFGLDLVAKTEGLAPDATKRLGEIADYVLNRSF